MRKSKKKQERPQIIWPEIQAKKTDPQGSWTGVPADPDEVPVQDADDL